MVASTRDTLLRGHRAEYAPFRSLLEICCELACSLIIAGTIGLTQPARRLERDCELASIQAIPQVIFPPIFSITNKKYGDLVDF